jgi:enamine deaminase RidA (YjgF/YER057c/UK114 family)
VTRQHYMPPGLWSQTERVLPIYSQVIRVGQMVFLAGQPAYDETGRVPKVLYGDLPGQIGKAYENVQLALRFAGADWKDVVKMTSYVVHYERAQADFIHLIRENFFQGPPPVTTLVGVQSLAQPEILYEVDVIAVIG